MSTRRLNRPFPAETFPRLVHCLICWIFVLSTPCYFVCWSTVTCGLLRGLSIVKTSLSEWKWSNDECDVLFVRPGSGKASTSSIQLNKSTRTWRLPCNGLQHDHIRDYSKGLSLEYIVLVMAVIRAVVCACLKTHFGSVRRALSTHHAACLFCVIGYWPMIDRLRQVSIALYSYFRPS